MTITDSGGGPGGTRAPVPEVVDAHLHLWNPAVGYGWLAGAGPELQRLFTVDQATAVLTSAGIDSAVLVQADDTVADTEAMLAAAAAAPWVAGVVGWVRLDDEHTANAQLERWQGEPLVRGIRHLVHDDPRDDFLELSAVRASLRALAATGLTFDVPNAWPRHLGSTAELAQAIPDLTIVVDHLAKPPRGDTALADWRAALAHVATHDNTVAKVSGLHWPGQPYTVDAVRPVWEDALDLFGPDRLMYGGDWPMTVPQGGYLPTWRVLRTLIEELSPRERDQVLAGTARRVYGLGRRNDAPGSVPASVPKEDD